MYLDFSVGIIKCFTEYHKKILRAHRINIIRKSISTLYLLGRCECFPTSWESLFLLSFFVSICSILLMNLQYFSLHACISFLLCSLRLLPGIHSPRRSKKMKSASTRKKRVLNENQMWVRWKTRRENEMENSFINFHCSEELWKP